MTIEILKQKFFTDPDWKEVEKLLMDYINPLIEMEDVDTTQPAEHVKAEIIGRKKAHEGICKFLESSGIVGNPRDYKKVTTFK